MRLSRVFNLCVRPIKTRTTSKGIDHETIANAFLRKFHVNNDINIIFYIILRKLGQYIGYWNILRCTNVFYNALKKIVEKSQTSRWFEIFILCEIVRVIYVFYLWILLTLEIQRIFANFQFKSCVHDLTCLLRFLFRLFLLCENMTEKLVLNYFCHLWMDFIGYGTRAVKLLTDMLQ